MLEIYTLAQTCLWELGYSAFAEALRAGQDVHMVVAAQILGRPLEWCVANKKDPEVKNARNAGKAVNFGRPGGLSAKTMRSYAVKSYGVSKTVEEWQSIIDIWNATWSEMPAYFALVNRSESYPKSGLYNVRYSGVPGYRALATYCSACNSKYQRLGAKVAKRALWYVFLACYTRGAEGSGALFGCRPNLFVHDQIMVEVPEGRSYAAAEAVGALMNRAGRELLPDVPVPTEPILCRRWSKNAEAVRDENGRLVPWEDVRLGK
jgi:DNA polymerase-1